MAPSRVFRSIARWARVCEFLLTPGRGWLPRKCRWNARSVKSWRRQAGVGSPRGSLDRSCRRNARGAAKCWRSSSPVHLMSTLEGGPTASSLVNIARQVLPPAGSARARIAELNRRWNIVKTSHRGRRCVRLRSCARPTWKSRLARACTFGPCARGMTDGSCFRGTDRGY